MTFYWGWEFNLINHVNGVSRLVLTHFLFLCYWSPVASSAFRVDWSQMSKLRRSSVQTAAADSVRPTRFTEPFRLGSAELGQRWLRRWNFKAAAVWLDASGFVVFLVAWLRSGPAPESERAVCLAVRRHAGGVVCFRRGADHLLGQLEGLLEAAFRVWSARPSKAEQLSLFNGQFGNSLNEATPLN